MAVETTFRRRTPSLPVFGAEYAHGLAVFARRFFEALFARMPEGTFLVLDDYHELPADAPTHEALREGIVAIPSGIRVIVLSRQVPPSAFARLLTNGHIDVLEWTDLRMSPGEARALLRKHAPHGFSPQEAATMLQLADGWPVGLILLATGYRSELALPAPLASRDRELLFSYFASEVLDRMEPDRKALLLKTSLLPRCSAEQAERITGCHQAEQHFRSLAKTGYLVVEHGRTEPMFEFHPLFRAFLSHRASQLLEPREWSQLRIRSATLLEEEGQLHEAFELLRDAREVALLLRMILAHAPALLGQGQSRTLAHWLEALPEETILEHGWLSLWTGLCRMSSHLPESRRYLERAFERFLQQGDVPGQMLAWAAVVDSYLYGWDDYSSLDVWIQWLDQHVSRFEALSEASLVEPVSVSMAWALEYRQPDHPAIRSWMIRTERILREGSHPQIRLRAGTAAFMFHYWSGEHVACEALSSTILQLAHALREPMAIITSYWAELGMLTWNRVTRGRSQELIRSGLAMGERYGVHFCDFMFHGQAVVLALWEGDLEAARTALNAMEKTSQGHNSQSFYHYLAGWAAFSAGDLPAATAHAELGVERAVASGMPSSEVMNRIALADLLFETGQREEAQLQSRLAGKLVPRVHSPIIAMMHGQGVARRGLVVSSGDAHALEHLRRALALGREYGFVNRLWWVPAWTTQLCMAALEHGIEPESARQLIQLHDLRPETPPIGLKAWPWRIRITTLGSFSILRDGKELVFPTKAPRKVLLLLKAIIAGGRRGAVEDKLADWLWPDSDGDASRSALATALHRLRQLLSVEGCLLAKDGRLLLDPHRCYVDAHAFELLAESGRVEGPGLLRRTLPGRLGGTLGPELPGAPRSPVRQPSPERSRGRSALIPRDEGIVLETAAAAAAVRPRGTGTAGRESVLSGSRKSLARPGGRQFRGRGSLLQVAEHDLAELAGAQPAEGVDGPLAITAYAGCEGQVRILGVGQETVLDGSGDGHRQGQLAA